MSVPSFTTPPPFPEDRPVENREPRKRGRDAGLIANTVTALPPLTSTAVPSILAMLPGPLIAIGPAVSVRAKVFVRTIGCGEDALKTLGSNWMMLPAGFVLLLA